MIKTKQKDLSQTLIIVIAALALATVGYYGYKMLLTSPDINQITTKPKPSPTPKASSVSVTSPKPSSTPKASSINKATPKPTPTPSAATH